MRCIKWIFNSRYFHLAMGSSGCNPILSQRSVCALLGGNASRISYFKIPHGFTISTPKMKFLLSSAVITSVIAGLQLLISKPYKSPAQYLLAGFLKHTSVLHSCYLTYLSRKPPWSSVSLNTEPHSPIKVAVCNFLLLIVRVCATEPLSDYD